MVVSSGLEENCCYGGFFVFEIVISCKICYVGLIS